MYSALCRYYSVACVAILNEVEIGSVDTPMVAGMKDVVAVVRCVVGDPFQIGIRSISGE